MYDGGDAGGARKGGEINVKAVSYEEYFRQIFGLSGSKKIVENIPRKYYLGNMGSVLHRFLWEQKVAKKVKVCKLFSQLSSCTLFMGAKSCEKSLEPFTFDNNRAIWSKSLQTFRVANVAEESCTAEKIPVRGLAKS